MNDRITVCGVEYYRTQEIALRKGKEAYPDYEIVSLMYPGYGWKFKLGRRLDDPPASE